MGSQEDYMETQLDKIIVFRFQLGSTILTKIFKTWLRSPLIDIFCDLYQHWRTDNTQPRLTSRKLSRYYYLRGQPRGLHPNPIWQNYHLQIPAFQILILCFEVFLSQIKYFPYFLFVIPIPYSIDIHISSDSLRFLKMVSPSKLFHHVCIRVGKWSCKAIN